MADRSLGYSVFLDADTKRAEQKIGAFAESMHRRIERAIRSLPEIQLDADASPVDRRIQEIRRELQTLSGKRIGIDIDAGAAQAQLDRLRRELVQLGTRSATVQVQADVASAAAALAVVSAQARRLDGQNVNIAVEARDVARVVSLLGLLSAGLAGVSAAVAPAAAALAALPALAGAAAQGVGALAVGFSGVGGAVKALSQAETKAAAGTAASASQRVNSAQAIASAQRQVERAVTAADRTAIEGAQRVADARTRVAEVAEDGARRIATAERAVAEARRNAAEVAETGDRELAAAEDRVVVAQNRARDAQEDLNQARRDAVEDIEDLQLSLRGAALSEEEATLRVVEAREKLAAAREAGITGRDLQKLDLDARQAALGLDIARERHADLAAEAAHSHRVGVEGSDRVVAAQDRVNDALASVSQAYFELSNTRRSQDLANAQAQSRIADAERDLSDARRQATRDNTEAQQQLGRAQQQAAFAQQDAAERVADAQRALAKAYQDTGTQGQASVNKVQEAMEGLSPEAQRFARFLVNEVIPGLKGIRDAVQATLLPRMETSLRNLSELSPIVSAGLAETGRVIGDLSVKGSEMMTSGPWRADFATIMAGNNRVLEDFGEAGLDVTDMLRNLTVTSLPMVERFSQFIERVSEMGRQFLESKRATGELDEFFARMGDTLAELGGIVAEIVVGVFHLTQAMAPLGMVLLRTLADFVGLIGELARANPGITQLVATALIATAAFNAIGRTIAGVGVAARVATSGWKTLAGVITGLAPSAVAGTAAMTALHRGMDTAALGAGTFTERMTGSAAAGEKVATAGGKVSSAITKIGSSLPLVGAALIGATLAFDALHTSSGEAADALLKGGAAADKMRAELQKGENSAPRWAIGYGILRTSLADATAEMDKQRAAMDPLARATSIAAEAQNNYLFAVEKYGPIHSETAIAQQRFRDATAEVTRQQNLLKTGLDDTTASLEEQINQVLTAVETDIRYRETLDRATKSIEENGRITDLNTEAGRRNQSALIDLARAARDEEAALQSNGATVQELTRKEREHRDQLFRVAVQMGFTNEEARRLTDRYLGVPPRIDTRFLAHVNPAIDAVHRMAGDIDRAISGINDEEIRIQLHPLSPRGFGRFATGGPIYGPGTETSDSIPALVSHNEHVWTGREVRGAGGHGNVERLRHMAVHGQIPRFAAGGAVNMHHPLFGISDVARVNAEVVREMINRMKRSFAGGMIGGATGPGSWQWQMRVLRRIFPGLQLISGFRPGSITATGNLSYHARGRAVDVPPRWDVFNWIKGTYGANTKELIFSPAGAGQIWNGRPHYYSGVTRRDHWCVPLDVEILTRRGWLTYDQVCVGDETPGLNQATGNTQWTKILAVNVFDSAEVFEAGNNRGWLVRATANHRWVASHTVTGQYLWATTESRARHSWVVAAPMEDGPGVAVSDDEAELLGWLITDGSQHNGFHHRGVNFSIHVWQTKPVGVARLAEILGDRASWNGKGFRLRNGYARDLLHRSELSHIKDAEELNILLMNMTGTQRLAMLRGIIGGDGTAGSRRICQDEGPLLDVMALLVYYCGYRTRVEKRAPFTDGAKRNGVAMSISLARPQVSTHRYERRSLGDMPVWCPTTRNGSWTARFGHNPVLTGNSHVHWAYDNGGVLAPGMRGVNTTSHPERVLSPRQTEAFEKLVEMLTRWLYDPGADVVRFGSISDTDWNRLLRQGWRGDPTDRMEALYRPQQNFIKYGTIPDEEWDKLLAQGWRGDPTDRMEALYPPIRLRGSTVPHISTNASTGEVHKHYHLTVHNAANNRVDLETQFHRLELRAGI